MSALVLELCVTELEDAACDTEALRQTPRPVVQESTHPYTNNMALEGTVKIPGEGRERFGVRKH